MITIITAIKAKQKRFVFEGSDIPLKVMASSPRHRLILASCRVVLSHLN
jgi:hypothetical protein